MHSPASLALRLARQWQNADLREARLVGGGDGSGSWPIQLPIGRPAARIVAGEWASVAAHIQAWREVAAGRVIFEPVTYRATGEPCEVPVGWEIADAAEWVKAASDHAVTAEYRALQSLLRGADPLFHTLFIRHRSLWREKPLEEILKAAALALRLEPGCARGLPLRALSFGEVAGIDSKFLERHRSLLLRLLDLRFDGEPSQQGLECFLDAWQEADHWLLVADLDGALLPFSQQRVRSSELGRCITLAARRVIVVENERCLHLLPTRMPGTIAILGAGNNLAWLGAEWLRKAHVGYWGDIDTWGLALLANARRALPGIRPLLMNREVFERHAERLAVKEKVPAAAAPPELLTPVETALYLHLYSHEKGRLEQEFLPPGEVIAALRAEFSLG